MSVLLKQNFRLFCVCFRCVCCKHACVPRLSGARRVLKRVSDDLELPLHVAVNYQVGAGNQTPFSVTARAFNH